MREKGERTREALADALLSILLDGGSAAVTVKSVAERAGVDRQTFYYHFPNIEAAALFLSQREGRALMANLSQGDSFEEDVRDLLGKIDGRKPILRAIAVRLGYPLLGRMLKERAKDLIGARMDSLPARPYAPVDERRRSNAARYCSLATAAALEEWIVGESPQGREELADFLIASFSQQMAGLEKPS